MRYFTDGLRGLGKLEIGPNTAWIELVIRDVAGVPERVFRWTP
jgi:hypothetical protein